MKNRKYLIALLLFFSLSVMANKNKEIQLFENINLRFDMDSFPTNFEKRNEIIWIANGRIALKKVKIPTELKGLKAKLEITLTSNGDPWDKAGSLFVIPSTSKINMVNIAKGKTTYPKVDSTKYEKLVGTISSKNYQPVVELMRFMTPFGVGHFSKKDTSKHTMPVYIDGWAKKVVWEEDITELLPTLEKETYVGVYVDTWTKAGYRLSAKITFGERNIQPKTDVLPLVNTLMYMGQSLPDIFARQDLEIPFSVPQKAKNVRLKYIVSGHGGHSKGDEFTPQENILLVDKKEVKRFTPWRTDCASFRRYNPTSGNWAIKREATYYTEKGKETKEITEILSSSDLSRSNWCPGSYVKPITVPLKNIKKGNHTLTISIPKAQQATKKELNHWLVSAYLVWDL